MAELLSAAELAKLYTALDAVDAQLDDEEAPLRDESTAVDTILRGQRFAAVAARRLGDVAFLDRLTAGLQTIDGYELSSSPTYEVRRILERLVARAPAGAAVAALARSRSARVRAAVAAHVQLPQGQEILRGLAADAHRAVRAPARQRLGTEAPAPWVGVLSADPGTLVEAEVLEAARGILGSVLAWCNRAVELGDPVLPPGVARLPEPLAVDVLARIYGSERHAHVHRDAPTLEALLRFASGVGRAWAVWAASDDRMHVYVARSALTRLPPAEAADRSVALVRRVVEATRGPDGDETLAVECASSAVEQGWPAEADPQRLYAALAPVVDPATDVGEAVRGRLARGLVRAADPAIAEALLAARAAGDEATAGRVGRAFDALVAVLPAERRAEAARAALALAPVAGAGAPAPDVAAPRAAVPWGVRALLESGTATDAERRAWLADAALRDALIGSHATVLRALLRDDLVAGALDVDEAARVVPHLEDDAEAWAVFRRMRARAWDDSGVLSPPMFTWPAGAWTDEDHAHAERLVRAMEEDPEAAEGFALTALIALRRRTDVDALLPRVRAVLPEAGRAAAARYEEALDSVRPR